MTSHIISDIVVHQGDIFTVNEDGQYTMLGRHADVIKTADGHVSDTLSYVFDHKAHLSLRSSILNHSKTSVQVLLWA